MDIFVGRTGNDLCLVTTVLSYIAQVQVLICKWSSPYRPRLVANVKEALAKTGVDPGRYSGHNFRSGAASTAASRGVGDASAHYKYAWEVEEQCIPATIKTLREQLAEYSCRVGGDP